MNNLFAKLSEIDANAPEGTTIYIAPIPVVGIGQAINDRLARAVQSGEQS